MERKIIESKVPEIPVSELGVIPSDEEIWEETDGGAHFKLTRHVLPVEGSLQFLSLSVSGHPLERQRIIGEFSEVLGTPTATERDFASPDHIDLASWLVEEPIG